MELCDDKVLGIYICDLAVELIDALTAAAGAVLQLFKLSDQIAQQFFSIVRQLAAHAHKGLLDHVLRHSITGAF
mgnify:FL=1